jgi:Flp pilus assembly protein TadD
LMRAKRYDEAVAVATPVTNIDPSAHELRSSLIACLAALGSTDAAQAHYRTLAALYHRDFGTPLGPYEEVVRGSGS